MTHERLPVVTEPDQQRALIFRRGTMTTDHIERFVSILIRECFERDLRYDAVYIALHESSIQPLPSVQCEAVHFETRLERQNAVTDGLVHAIAADDTIRAAVAMVIAQVLNRLTMPAREEHLSIAEVDAFVECCLADCEHIAEYDRYADLYAHVGACLQCDRRVRAKWSERPGHSDEP